MVVINDRHGGKDVIEGRDGWTDRQTCPLAIGRVRVKTDAQICLHIITCPDLILHFNPR
jgi:hypothetical protein